MPSELSRRGIVDISELSFGESISKIARHELALLCIKCIRKELNNNPSRGKGRGRGRPPSPMGVLAIRIGVHIDSVKRWLDLSQIQACDLNATKLAEMAYRYSPEGVVQILQEDIERRREILDKWRREIEGIYPVRPCVVNPDVEEEVILEEGSP